MSEYPQLKPEWLVCDLNVPLPTLMATPFEVNIISCSESMDMKQRQHPAMNLEQSLTLNIWMKIIRGPGSKKR